MYGRTANENVEARTLILSCVSYFLLACCVHSTNPQISTRAHGTPTGLGRFLATDITNTSASRGFLRKVEARRRVGSRHLGGISVRHYWLLWMLSDNVNCWFLLPLFYKRQTYSTKLALSLQLVAAVRVVTPTYAR